jgi:hypothetical protein
MTVPGTCSDRQYGRNALLKKLKRLMMPRDFTDRKKNLILILGPFLKQRPLKNYLFSK